MDEADLTIDVSDELYEALKRQGEANGRTPDEEARAILIGVLQSHSISMNLQASQMTDRLHE